MSSGPSFSHIHGLFLPTSINSTSPVVRPSTYVLTLALSADHRVFVHMNPPTAFPIAVNLIINFAGYIHSSAMEVLKLLRQEPSNHAQME